MAPLVSGEREQTLSGISRKSLTGEAVLRPFIYGRSRSASLLPVKLRLFMRFSEAQKRPPPLKAIRATCPPSPYQSLRDCTGAPGSAYQREGQLPSNASQMRIWEEEQFARACVTGEACLTIQLGRVFASGCALPPPRARARMGMLMCTLATKTQKSSTATPHPRWITQTRRL